MTRDLSAILRGGYCTRWHANPDMAHIRETLAEHHARVAQILLALHPAPSLALIDAALHHDAGEPLVGDLPQPFKAAFPLVAAQHAACEDEALAGLGLAHKLNRRDADWLKLADRLAALAHVAKVAPQLLLRDGWPEDYAMAMKMASQMDCAAVAAEMLLKIELGR